jgi:hypothetical protein
MEKQIVHSKLYTIFSLSNFLKSYCCCVDPNLYFMSTTISKPDSVVWTLFLYASATNSDEESVICGQKYMHQVNAITSQRNF